MNSIWLPQPDKLLIHHKEINAFTTNNYQGLTLPQNIECLICDQNEYSTLLAESSGCGQLYQLQAQSENDVNPLSFVVN